MAKEIIKKRKVTPQVKKVLDEVEKLTKKDAAEKERKLKFRRINQRKREAAARKAGITKQRVIGVRTCVYFNRHVYLELVEKANAAHVSFAGAVMAGCRLWLDKSESERQALAMRNMLRQRPEGSKLTVRAPQKYDPKTRQYYVKVKPTWGLKKKAKK